MRKVLGSLLRPMAVERTGDDSPASSIWRYVRRMTGMHQVCVCLMALLVAGLNLAPLELQRRLIDDAIAGEKLDLLIWLGALYAGVFLALRVVKFLLRLYQGWLTESTVRYTRRHLVGIYDERAGSDEARRSGEAVAVINNETDKLGGFVGSDISQAVSNLAMAVGIVGYMLVVEPMVALVALGAVLPQALVAPVMQRRLNRLTERRLGYLREFGQRIADDEVGPGEKTEGRLSRIYRNQISFFFWKYLMKEILSLLNGLGPIVVLTFGGWMAIQGETTVGVLVAFISGFERLANPVRELITFYRNAEQARVQHDMIATWMTGDPSWQEKMRKAQAKERERTEREAATRA